jgi:hypothetical protein
MKCFYCSLVFVFYASQTFSQIVNIPDANFKNTLVNTVCVDSDGNGSYDSDADVNNDGEIQLSEALLVQGLRVVNQSVVSLTGIESFTNIMTLNISNNPIITVDLTQNTLLENLVFSLTDITDLNLTQHPNLQTLDCSFNELSALDLTQNVNLVSLEFDNNMITSIDLTQNVNLEYLYFPFNDIEEIDLSQNTNLTFINCLANSIDILDLNANINLETLFAGGNNLDMLFLKNGLTTANLNFDGNSNLRFICADGLTNIIQSRLNQYGYDNVVVNGYCNFTPGGEFYKIEGNAIVDLDNNGCDLNDNNYPLLKFEVFNGNTIDFWYASNLGNFNIPVQEGSYQITPVFEYPSYFSLNPTLINITFPQDNSPFLQDFCIVPNGNNNDLEILLLPLEEARPGFDVTYRMIYWNKGTTNKSGYVEFIYSDNLDVSSVTSVEVPEDSQNAGVLSWNFTNLQPFESRSIDITLSLNSPTDADFPLNGGDLLSYNSKIFPVVDDQTPSNNASSLRQLLVNSFDPNDKTCLEGEAIAPELVGEYVHYIIRFENTGTASAINVVVKDEIDTSKFDINTLIPLHASHDFVTRILNTNEVEFVFENINLPFDDANNDGFIVFKIKTLDTLVLDDTFSNDAEIYFDFNFPIVTNDYITTVAEDNLSIENYVTNTSIKLFPNPVNDILNISTDINLKSISVSDINGRILQTIVVIGNKNRNIIDLKSLSKGVYFVTVKTESGQLTQKLIKN